MKNTILIISLALLCATVSCSIPAAPKKTSAFSDIEIYFQSEITALKISGLTLSKKLTHKGKTETVFIENPDWPNELVPFTETISNQPAHIQSYTKDSMITGDSKVILLTAKDASATVKSLAIYSTAGNNDSIVIIKKVDNSYYASSDTLTYYGNGNYLVKAENLPGIGKKIGFILEGKTHSKK